MTALIILIYCALATIILTGVVLTVSEIQTMLFKRRYEKRWRE